MAEQEGYSPRNRAERVISAARLFLAAFLTLSVAIDSDVRRFPELIEVITIGYLTYAAGVAVLTWTRRVTTRGVPIVTHVIDMAIFALMCLLDGPNTPFFAYFVFATICGAIRWHGRGALLTGLAAVVLYVAAGVGSTYLGPAAPLDRSDFVAYGAQLAMVAGLLGYLGTYQHRLQGEITSLAAWPRRLPMQGHEALQEVLAYAATVLGVVRLVLVWEEGDEPSLRIATHSGDGFALRRERPDAFGTIVAESLERSSFVCTGIGTRRRKVLQRVPGGFRYWNGDPLDARFREAYAVSNAIALRLSSENVEGWLFAMDRPWASADELLLGDIVGRLVASALDLQILVEQLRESAAGEERVHLARELHDGVLQSLTAASLQAQRARQCIASSPAEAERRLAMVEETILAEQQALRLAIEDLKPGAIKETSLVDVVPRVRDVATRVARQWDVRPHLNLQRGIPAVPQKVAHELTRMVQEALVNAIRHGTAREVTVTCLMLGAELAVSVSYQGKGFAGFTGRHDLASLNRMRVGPRTLKERVAALGGALTIESGESGARVEMRIPLRPTP
jgi:signal transduction histidine kinase